MKPSISFKRFFLLLLLAIPLVVLFVALLMNVDEPFTIYPGNESKVAFFPYSDSVEGGHSTIDSFETNGNTVTVAYTLRKGIESPYAGLNCNLLTHGTYTDVSAYDAIDLEIDSEREVTVKILLRYYIDGYSNEKEFWSYGALEKEILLSPRRKHYSLPLSEFSIPVWWYGKASRGVPEGFVPVLKKLSDINIDDSIFTREDRHERLSLYAISFDKSGTVISVVAISLGVSYCILFLLLFVRSRSNPASLRLDFSDHAHVALAKKKDEDLGKITDMIKTHYHEPGISASRVYSHTGINTRRINALVREKYKCNVTRLINSVRIEEAKRLLLATDRQVLEIALSVGFSNAVHFNRVFRELAGTTPKEYRAGHGNAE